MRTAGEVGIMQRGTMDDRGSALRNRSGSRTTAGVLTPARKWSRAPHHRRRRATALGFLLFLLPLLGILVFAGGGSTAHQAAPAPGGFFSRVQRLAGPGSGSFAATETAAENGAIDRTLGYTPWVRIAGSQHREVALTFDDGPGPYTPDILSVLHRANVPATFFEVGVLERYFHASTSEIVRDRFTIGDHTFLHAPMSRLSRSDQRAQLLEQVRAVGQYGAPFPRLFRPPYGLWDSTTLQLLRRYRMLMVLWTVDTSDYREPGSAAIVKSVLGGVRPGAIILLHDAGGNRSETVTALRVLIPKLKARGYKMVTVPKLLLDNPAPHNQQITSVIGSGG